MRRETFPIHWMLIAAMGSVPFGMGTAVLVLSTAGACAAAQVPGEVVFPQEEWIRITPRQAGLDAEKFRELLATASVHGGGWGGNRPATDGWGAVLTRGGYLVHTWGDPRARYQSASLGKCMTRVLFGLSVEAGRLHPDEPIWKTWTGRGQLSHPHKYLDAGLHRQLTWRNLLEHQGGFVLESAHHWRTRTLFHARIPAGVRWTGDPLFDNFCHTPPGTVKRYSSGGYWRLGQALTALWDRDLKEVLDERLFSKLGIPADHWDWLAGKHVHDTKDFYPDIPGYGEYLGPPYEINGHSVRGGPGWIVMSASDLARFGLLIATGGVWKGERLVDSQWLRGHAGLDIHVVAGDPETKVSIAKINAKGFPFGSGVGTQGTYAFPRELIAGPIDLAQEASRDEHAVVVEKGVRIPMRDGITLAADIYRPDATGSFPTLMTLTYYPTGGRDAETFARHGYVGVVVNSRGRNGSQGEWDPYVHEPRDGYDAQQLTMELEAASTAIDTDFTATLTDVYPDGRAIHICEGICRASFRESLEHPSPIEPGKIYRFRISLWETSIRFRQGHRIRLEISSSNFPRYARNLNTGLPVGTSEKRQQAQQTVVHDARHASYLLLPVIPSTNARDQP